MTEERIQSEQEKAIRKYFHKVTKPSNAGGITLIVVGAVFLLAGLAAIKNSGFGCTIPGIVVGGLGIIIVASSNLSYQERLKEGLPKPSDNQVDTWLEQGLDKLVRQSLNKLGLDKGEAIADPLVIKGPILWTTNGIDNGDLVWKKGDDDLVRFGVYRVTIIQLTNRHLGAYACDYNFIKDVSLNERTDEYHYKDVVSVSTQEEASSYTLPTGIKLTTAQEFKLSVASGESIRVTIGAPKIREITGSDKMPEPGAEKAVSVIRAMLREKKE